MGLFDQNFQNVTSSTQVPTDVQGFRTDTLNMAQALTTRPYQPYPNMRVAPFTNLQREAMTRGADVARQQPWQGAMSGATSTLGMIANPWGSRSGTGAVNTDFLSSPMARASMDSFGGGTAQRRSRNMTGRPNPQNDPSARGYAGYDNLTENDVRQLYREFGYGGDWGEGGAVKAWSQMSPQQRDAFKRRAEALNRQRARDFPANPPASPQGNAMGVPFGVRDVMPGSQTDVNMDPYMNPFTQRVIDTTLQELQRQHGIAQAGIDRDFAGSGAYGGSRQMVANQEAARNLLDKTGQVSAGLNMENFRNAQDIIQTELERRFRGDIANQGADLEQRNQAIRSALGLADVGRATQGMTYDDIARMYDIGSRQQEQGQTNLDVAYQDYLRQWEYPQEQLNRRLATMSGVPYGSRQTSQVPAPNPWAQALGMGLTGVDLAKQFKGLWS